MIRRILLPIAIFMPFLVPNLNFRKPSNFRQSQQVLHETQEQQSSDSKLAHKINASVPLESNGSGPVIPKEEEEHPDELSPPKQDEEISSISTKATTEIPSDPFMKTNGSSAPIIKVAEEVRSEELSQQKQDQQVEIAKISTIAPDQESPAPTQEAELLPIDKNSTISDDIVKIWHNPESKEVCVELKPNARCPYPALLGRLSGPALAMLEWNKDRQTESGGTVLCGGYDHYWLDAGDYYVEIIILFCKDFGVNFLKRSNDLDSWLEANHTLKCIEDAKHHTITSKDGKSMIHIPTSSKGKGSYRQGRWVRKQGISSRPLFERFQPLECFKPTPSEKLPAGDPLKAYCDSITKRDNDGIKKGTNVTGLYEYEFQWNMKVSEQELIEKLRQRQGKDGKTTPKICGLGDSHTRFMHSKSLKNLKLNGLFELVVNEFPAPHKVVRGIRGKDCSVYFSQCGQWPASRMTGGKPFSFGKYYRLMKEHVEKILSYNPNATVYLPAMDPHPVSATLIECSNWRSATYLDAYSYANQMIVQALNTSQVKYLDISWIVDSWWDGNDDWQHLPELVRQRKTIYMMAHMLGETEWAGLVDSSSL